MPQPQSRQQPGLNDIQMLQGHIMLKQFQELQRQRQLQGLGDGQQLNYINQLSAMNKQTAAGQYIPLINGIPTRDAQQKFMANNVNFVQHGSSPTFQGLPNGSYSPNQNQDLRSIGLVPRQLEEPLYGTPVASSTNNSNQYPHLQGLSHDSGNALGKSNVNQTEKVALQRSGFGNSFLGENGNVSSPQQSIPDKDFLSKQFFQGKDLFGQVPIQGFTGEIIPENQQTLQFSGQEFNRRRDQAGWPEQFPGRTPQTETSQGLPTLDPLEQKILFNMDDNSWNASFGANKEMGTEGFGNTMDHVGYSSSFASIQSGTWSALMQSAVAEASSNDTGLQEEWSGLTFQNTELSSHNQLTNYLDSGKLQTAWPDNNSTSSPSCKPQLLFNDSNMSPGFHGYQQLGIQFPINQREGIYSDSSHESVQPSPKVAAKWSDHKSQLNQLVQGSQPIHRIQSLDNAWSGQNFEYSEGNLQHQSISSGSNNQKSNNEMVVNKLGSSLPSGTPKLNVHHSESVVNKSWVGDMNGAFYEEKVPNNCLWRDNHLSSSFTNAAGGLDQVKPSAGNIMVEREDTQLNNVASLCNSVTTKVDQETSQCVSEHRQHDYIRPDISVESKGNEIIGDDFYQPSKIQVLANCYEGAGKSSDGKHNCYNTQKSSDSHLSNVPQHRGMEAEGRENRWMRGSDSQSLLKVNQSPSGQECLQDIQRTSKASETPEAPLAKSYDHSSVAQLIGSRLAPASQALPNSSSFSSLQSSLQSGNFTAISSASSYYLKNQLQRSHLPDTTVATQSSEAMLFGMTNRVKGSSCATSQGPQSNSWTNMATQMHLSDVEPGKIPSNLLFSADAKNNNLQAPPWATQGLHDQNSNMGTVPQEVGPYSMNSQGLDYEVVHPAKKGSQQQIHLDVVDHFSHTHGLFQPEYVTNYPSERAIASSSSVPNSYQQNLDGAHRGDKQAPPVSAGDLEAFGRSLKPSNVHPSYSLLQQVHSLNNVETDSSRRASDKNSAAGSDLNVQHVTAISRHQMMNGYNSGFRDPVNDGLSAVSRLNSFPTGEVKMLSFSPEVGDNQTAKASPLPLLEDTLQQTATSGQSCHQNDFSRHSLTFSGTELSHLNLQMVPSGHQQYGKHGQMLSIYARKPIQQFPPGRPFENLHMNTCLVQANDVGAGEISRVGPTTSTGLAEAKSSPSLVLPPDAIDQNWSVIRPKKRKTATYELLPWHKEVSQSSKRLQTISMGELEWARAAHRLTEKVEDQTEMIEGIQAFMRPKKRLVLTTQLMQLVFRPAPASFLSADASSNYDSVSYFAAKLVLGDACNLISSSRTNSCTSSGGHNGIPEKLSTSEKVGDQYFPKILENFTSRARKLENDLFRLEKTASILDIKVEYQELEKFSIINRFAKYHSRGQQPDAMGTSSSGTIATAGKSFPQRYVVAFPMPKAVPEGAQCLSL
ncbi:hypothetical protein NMG60_11006359 [Bertholletia excelsa]